MHTVDAVRIYFSAISVSVPVLYWKLTQSLSKSYPGVLGSCQSCEIAALKPSTVLLLMALSVSVFQSLTVLGKKECLYISVVAESALICLLLDVLDGCWLYSMLLSAGMATRSKPSLTILKRRTSLCSFLLSFSVASSQVRSSLRSRY